MEFIRIQYKLPRSNTTFIRNNQRVLLFMISELVLIF